jgi:PKD repeat protein
MTGTEITGHDGWGQVMAGQAADGVSAVLSEFGALDDPIDFEDYIFGVGVRSGMYSVIEMYDCCDIHDNDVGVFAWGVYDEPQELSIDQTMPLSLATANNSNIRNNSNWGVFNFWGWYETESPDTGTTEAPDGEPYWLDFTQNFWGSDTGPNAPDHSGEGDQITTYIDYATWLATPCGKPAGPSAKFTASSVRAKAGASIQFKDISTPTPNCTIEEWLWEFGDGATSTAQNPSHTYRRPGTYTVKLTVWDSCQNSATYSMMVTIASGEESLEPAKLGVSYLNIDPVQVLPNQEVVVSANICNSGEERGSKTVSLMLNGEAVQSQSVSVSPGACQQVVFKVSRAVPGTYQVAIDGMTGQFSVLAQRTVTRDVPSQQQTGLGTAGIIAIIAVLIVLILALILVFRRD